MGVGMVQLDQGLVARLEAHQGEGWVDFEDGESLLACRQRAPHWIPPMVAVAPAALPCAFRAAGEHAEMVADSIGITGAVAITQPPARALPDGVVADLGLDLGITHPCVIVPRRVVD